MITIEINTPEEALHLQNVAALNIGKYKSNPVEGQQHLQSTHIRLWRNMHTQAGDVLKTLIAKKENASCNT
ncbi:hypothetical protein G3U99_23215 [Vibrio coralliilyticus OCN008]|uniref:hypothetical protein n=1 Tax=Vibrio coralliilyticus TaxID=190893 RepID=UPI0003914D88|nr:hypothetical protein [Vibrio coralliilyticus]ERB66330.1 hypothetical protein N779_05530 [Vibrio coralliilyticus OCN008]QIJ87146.1 hypothetical protein G3U99_23215 [Vibrio coralliilyticus OCN008]